jgi:hypothetical protein
MQTDRERAVTEMVSLWITNDGDRYETARAFASVYGGGHEFILHMKRLVRQAPLYSAPWYVAQDMSPNDYNRVDWASVARDLIGD